jgi:glutamyl endopeptidase
MTAAGTKKKARKKAAKKTDWIRRELATVPASKVDMDDLLWTPLQAKHCSRSYMTETLGGGRIEAVPGVDRQRAMLAGLESATYARSLGEMEAQAAVVDQPFLAPVTSTASIPWRSICQLIITRQNGIREYGTAWFVGPQLLVTAGHCILDPQHGGWASSIQIVPAVNGAYPPPFGMFQAIGMEAHPNWVGGGNPGFDYGFLSIADGTIGKQLGWFGMAVLPDDRVRNMMVNVAGYPATKPQGTMWFDSGRIVSAEAAFLVYMMETQAGDSGGPVFWLGDNQRVVVAVHAYHSVTGNRGVRITAEMYQRISALRGF